MTEKKNSRFSRWFYGEEDPLLGRVEMKPQKEYKEEESSVQERMREYRQLQEVCRSERRRFPTAISGWMKRIIRRC